MLQASIDLGTNTCLLLVKDGESILHDESTVVRMGQDVDRTGLLHPDAMERVRACLLRYAQTAGSLGVPATQIIAVGTAQAREAKNAGMFFDEIKKLCGLEFKILSGEQEARATFIGAALPQVDPTQMVVMDIGGGSTEIVGEAGGTSLNIGAVRMTERFLKHNPVTDEEFWECEAAIDQDLQTLQKWREGLNIKGPQLVAVAGTAVTLAMLQLSLSQYDRAKIDGSTLSRGDVHRLVEELKWRTVQERESMVGMEAKRADVILAGALIFWRTMEVLDFETAIVSTRGLRYGVLRTR